MRRSSILLASPALAAATTATPVSAESAPTADAAADASTTTKADFDGDGFSDLASRVGGETSSRARGGHLRIPGRGVGWR